MVNVTLDVIYDELKKMEIMINNMDQKVENFMGFFEITNKEKKELEKIKTDTKKQSVSLDKLAKDLEVSL